MPRVSSPGEDRRNRDLQHLRMERVSRTVFPVPAGVPTPRTNPHLLSPRQCGPDSRFKPGQKCFDLISTLKGQSVQEAHEGQGCLLREHRCSPCVEICHFFFPHHSPERPTLTHVISQCAGLAGHLSVALTLSHLGCDEPMRPGPEDLWG